MSTKSIGITLVILGAGSFLLPLFGLQFKIMAIFGSYSWIAAVIAVIFGITLLIKKEEPMPKAPKKQSNKK